MKNNFRKLILAVAIITGSLLASVPSLALCPDCGSYIYVGDNVYFYCGNNGNTNCMRPCNPMQ